MSFGDGLKVALFCMAMVFALLGVLYGFIKLIAALLGGAGRGNNTGGRWRGHGNSREGSDRGHRVA